jgi:uncharacterized membrane protein
MTCAGATPIPVLDRLARRNFLMPVSSSSPIPESGAHALPQHRSSGRIAAVDILRGAVIVLMALDHARDFLGYTGFEPTDLAKTTPALFLTRWITHFCAPVFVFLAGAGAGLAAAKGKPRPALARSLLLRGVWLLILELTVVRAGWFILLAADLTYRFAMLQVIWALGWSMISLAALVYLPRRIMFALSLAILLGHDAFDHLRPDDLGPLSGLWKFLHVPEPIIWAGDHVAFVQYPLIPWPAVMALGYLFAPILLKPREDMRRACLLLGVSLSLAFVLLRAVNIYADPAPWERGSSPLFTLFSFLNTTKYPPSLCYLLMTLGPAIALLPFLDRLPAVARRPLDTFGKTPMFFYILHLYLLQLAGAIYAFARYGSSILRWTGPRSIPEDYYIGLAPVYLAWGAALILLYFPCRWYAAYKHRRPAWWHPYV